MDGRDTEREGSDATAFSSASGPNPRWAVFMQDEIPECVAVRDSLMAGSGRPSIDADRLLASVNDLFWTRAEELTSARTDVTWEGLCHLRAASGFDHRRLAAYLSTEGAVGVALEAKFAGYLRRTIPQVLGHAIELGDFDVAESE